VGVGIVAGGVFLFLLLAGVMDVIFLWWLFGVLFVARVWFGSMGFVIGVSLGFALDGSG